MGILRRLKDSSGKVQNLFLIIGGLFLLLFGVTKVPHLGTGANGSHAATSDMDIGVAHAEAGDSGGDSTAGSAGSAGSADSAGSAGGSSSGGGADSG